MIGKLKPGDLKPLHAIMFDRPGKVRGQGSAVEERSSVYVGDVDRGNVFTTAIL